MPINKENSLLRTRWAREKGGKRNKVEHGREPVVLLSMKVSET